MNEGYIRIHRKMLNNWIMQDQNTLAVWMYILMNASHKSRSTIVNGSPVSLAPGELIFGRQKAASFLGLSEQNVRTAIDRLKKSKMVTKRLTGKSTKSASVIYVIKWDTYQYNDNQANQEDNQEPREETTKSQPRANQEPTTIQECLNDSNESNVNSRLSKSRPSSPQEVADYASSINFDLDGQYFIDYQETRGWKLKGGQPVRDWKACVRTWKANGYAGHKQETQSDAPRYKVVN